MAKFESSNPQIGSLVDRHRKIFKIRKDFLKNRYEYCSVLKVS